MNVAERFIEHAVGYSVDWNSTAAWVQAAGSIIAIAVSAGFAIWAPMDAHAQSERNAVRRAINSLAVGIGSAGAAVQGLQAVLAAGQFSDHTARYVEAQIAHARRAFSTVPQSMYLGSAFEAVFSTETLLNTVEELVRRLQSGSSPQHVQVVLAELHRQSAATSAEGAMFKARNVDGCWMIVGKSDEELIYSNRPSAPGSA